MKDLGPAGLVLASGRQAARYSKRDGDRVLHRVPASQQSNMTRTFACSAASRISSAHSQAIVATLSFEASNVALLLAVSSECAPRLFD